MNKNSKLKVVMLSCLIAALNIVPGTSAEAAQYTPVEILLTAKERAWIANHPTITVSNNTAYPPFDFVSAGEPIGLSIDYVSLLAAKVGLKVDYVNYGSLSENLKMGMEQKIDVVHTIVKNEERQKHFTFSDSFISDEIVLYGRVGSERVNTANDLKGKRIGVIKGHAIFASYKQHFPDLDYVVFNTIMEALRALISHEIDIYPYETTPIEFHISQNKLQGIEIVGNEFVIENSEIDYRIAVHKNNPILMSIINKSVSSVTNEEFTAIKNKWGRPSDTGGGINLTLEEREWLAENNIIRVAASLETAPYEFIDEQSKISGITGAFLNEISKILNVEFVWSGNTSWIDGISKLKSGEAEIASYATRTPEREEYLSFADSYMRDQQVIFAREGRTNLTDFNFLDGIVLAQSKGSAIIDLIKESYPNLEIKEVSHSIEALKLVSNGEADAFIGSIASSSALLRSERIKNVRVTGSTPFNVDNGIAVRADLPLLFSAIQKALKQIDQDTRNGIISNGLSVPYQEQVDYGPLWYVLGTVSLIVFMMLIWNRKLILARKEAEDANETKTNFLASMSHDLRTPLNAIIGFSELIKKETFGTINNQKYSDYINHIHSSGNYLLHLVNDILDLAALEADGRDITYDSFDGEQLIIECKGIISKLADDKNIDIALNCAANNGMVYADKKALKQILMNLISNAVKFTPLNGRVTINYTCSEENSVFQISDTGCGISKENLEVITKPFVKVQSSPFVSRQEGTGLGLSIVQSLVDAHGGKLTIESIVSKGTTVTFTLPRQISGE